EVAQFISRVLTGPGAPWRAAAGIGASVRGWPAIGESVRTAGSALDHAFFGEYARAFRYTETTDEPRRIGDDVVAEYARMLDAADEGSATGVISALTESLCRPPHPSAAEARRLYRKLLLRLMLFRDEKGIQSPRLDRLGALWANIEAGGNAADIGRVLTEGTAELLSRIEETREHGRVVSEIKRYIMENFRDPAICIDVIAQAVSLSPAYACTRFKAVTGKTINGYLTEVRVSRAKEMLADPNGPRISEVAQRVGWPNADYFARVFRKATSRSPSEFREHTPSDSGD
ncbi:MAG TPA: AraC family transcriptional regulator, partial [Spirochaetia bacterium]|nr:AraC family transcriptional regulator [Spirochaetia bacterium]